MSDSASDIPDVGGSEVAADAFTHDPGIHDVFIDDPGANLFTAEIENVNATDWDVDADLIWDGVDDIPLIDEGGAVTEFDLPF